MGGERWLRWGWVGLVGAIAGTVWLTPIARSVRPEWEMEDFFAEGTPEREVYDLGRESFGGDAGLALLIVESPARLGEGERGLAALEAIRQATERLRVRPELEDVISPTHAYVPVRLADDEVALERALPAGQVNAARWARALEVLEAPPYAGVLLGRDHQVAVIQARLRPERQGRADREALRDALVAEGEELASAGLGWRAGGYPIQRVELSEAIQRELQRLGPWVALAMGAVLAVWFGHVAGVVLPLCVAGLAAVWTTGILGWVGWPPNVLAPAVYVLVAVVGVSDSVHVLSRAEAAGGGRAGLAAALREVWVPCLLTSVTTALGFSALALTGIPLVADFGLQVGVGVVTAYAVTLLVVPPLWLAGAWLGWPVRSVLGGRRGVEWAQEAANWLDRRTKRAPRRIVLAGAALAGVALVATAGVRVNARLLADLDPEHPIRETNRFLEERMSGVVPVDVLIEGEDVFGQEATQRVEALTERLREREGVLWASSAGDVLRRLHPLLRGVPEEDVLGLLPTALLLADDQVLRWVDPEAGRVRVRLLVRDADTADAMALFEAIERDAREVLGERLRSWVTGQGVLGQVVNQQIVRTFQASFWVALLAVSGVVCLVLRSPRVVGWGLIPNLWVVLVVAGVMGLVGIELRYTSALVLTVVFGLAVDDTIHVLSRLRGVAPQEDPVRHALRAAGPGVIGTSCVLAAGFVVLLASDFVPNRVLGGLLTVTAVAALAGDLWLLPALIRVEARSQTPGQEEEEAGFEGA